MNGTDHYGALIIGDGQAGGPLSTELVQAGYTTVVVEREHAGGTCVNEGCTPTKTMVASARVAYLAGRGRDFGVGVGPVNVNMAEVRERKRRIVSSFRDGSRMSVERGGAEFLKGEARFIGPKEVAVRLEDGGTRHLTAELIFINTGGRPFVPPVAGLDTVPFLDSTSIMELDALPDHLLIMGGGYIGLEFGQMFRRFGSRVTMVEQLGQLLGHEDADIASAVADILRQDGIDIHLQSTVRRVARGEDGEVILTVASLNGEREIAGSHLLVAVGRAPNTDRLNLAAAGVECDARAYVKVNERLETTAPGVYAMGDVAGSPPFTHISYDDHRIVRDNLLHGGNRTTTDRLIPYTVFIDPQLGRIGLSETEARERNHAVGVAAMPMSHVARAVEVGEMRGRAKAVVDTDTDQILGGAILGLEGGEIMAMLEIAMMGKLPYTALREGIFAHPTLAELFNNLFKSVQA